MAMYLLASSQLKPITAGQKPGAAIQYPVVQGGGRLCDAHHPRGQHSGGTLQGDLAQDQKTVFFNCN